MLAALPRSAKSGAKRADKYRAILRAAIRVFARRGYFNARVSEIARAAGVADGTIYLYFNSKDDLLVAIFEETVGRVLAEARAALEALPGPLEKLRRLAEMHLSLFAKDRNLAVVFQVELRQSTKFMERFSRTMLADYFQLIESVITEAQKRGIFRPEISPKLATKVFFGILDEMVTNWVLSHKRRDLTALADPILDIFCHGMRRRNHEAHR